MTKTDYRLTDLMEATISDSGLLKFFREQQGEKAQSRAENLEELVNATKDFEEEHDLLEEDAKPITAFLAYTSLESGERKSEVSDSSVQLMTLHSAKGLEFPVVFICGLEDGLFPSHFSRENPKNLEEERRLCYVGITRAMQHLYLTHAEKRRIFGRDEERHISRFIGEIPGHLVNEVSRKVNVKTPFRISSPSFFSKTILSNTKGKEDFEGFCLGERVSHPKFGEGTVVDHEGSGERARVHIRFDKFGNKWLALAYAKLASV
jgi:DNA helicase II / ATP-dependent DNA helicase PcrA